MANRAAAFQLQSEEDGVGRRKYDRSPQPRGGTEGIISGGVNPRRNDVEVDPPFFSALDLDPRGDFEGGARYGYDPEGGEDNYSLGGGAPGRRRLPAHVYLVVALGLLAAGWMGGWPGVPPIADVPRSLVDSLDLATSSIPGLSRLVGPRTDGGVEDDFDESQRPAFVFEHPYVSSSYYTSTKSLKTLVANEEVQVRKNLAKRDDGGDGPRTRLAIVRPFCEFDAEALPTTFTCWNALPPCKAAADDVGDEDDAYYEVGPDGDPIALRNETLGDRHLFDLVGSGAMRDATADVFLFYSQTFSENEVAIKAVDAIIDQFFEPGGWSRCFGNIYAIEANIPQELDLYIPSAQEELYNWVNGPNRQFEAAFRIIQSGEWGDYDGFYLMEGDSVPIKAHWLDVVLSEIEVNRPFTILGAQYDGDKWDNFYEKIPISLLHHTNGNAIYNTSHPLLERLVGQLEVEAPCPYNSIPYDYRMSQMWVEGTLGIVPELAPKIMLNEEGENITLSDNVEMFSKWAEIWEKEDPFKYTPVIHNYAATNLIPRHLGPEYIIHGAKLYSPWDPTKTDVTLVVSEWFFDRSFHLIKNLDEKDHPFSEVILMVPPVVEAHDDYDEMTEVKIRTQHRGAPDFMDLCEADVQTEWFMITNSYHAVARHVDLMFTPGTFKPVIPFTPATYPFCFKYPYCKETIALAQRINPGHEKVVLDMDMLYNTKERNAFCKEWREENGDEGEDLYKHQRRRLAFRKKVIGPPGPTGTSYLAFLMREKKDGMYKMTDRSLYGARPPFVKVFAKEEKLDGLSEDELAKRVGMTLLDNTTDCNCGSFETEAECADSGVGCLWRPLFESCHPPELIDGSEPICATTEAPTMAPTVSLPFETESPTSDVDASSSEEDSDSAPDSSWYTILFKSREHAASTTESNATKDSTLMTDDDAIPESSSTRKLESIEADEADTPDSWYETDDDAIRTPGYLSRRRKLGVDTLDSLYETDLSAEERLDFSDQARRNLDMKSPDIWDSNSTVREETKLPMKTCNAWDPSIVPRLPTVSSTWGLSLDPGSRSFSAMATSRPRRLHDSFLQYQLLMAPSPLPNSPEQQSALKKILSTTSPLKDSWVTSSVPINVPKYAMRQGSSRINHAALELEINRKTYVNYEEGGSNQPLRITFSADHFLDLGNHQKTRKLLEPVTEVTISKIEALTGDVLPAVSEIWAGALTVHPSTSNIFPGPLGSPNQVKCGEAKVSPHHLAEGVPNTDIFIYVTLDGPQCSRDENVQDLVSYSTVCSFDQHMRPISANIDVCLSNIAVHFGEVSEEENLRLTSILTIEVGKVLGLSPLLFHYFRSSETGQPYGSTEKNVTCVDGTEQTLLVPNILQSSSDLGFDATHSGPYFQLTTPTVKQIIRNHFDCQSLLGVRLIKGKNPSCFGDSFDPRYHFDDDLTPMSGSADMAFSLSPLTLALLEDSGWYRANFQKSTAPLFGRGAGCGFVEGNCIGDSQKSVPEYSQGFFCSNIPEPNQSLVPDHDPLGCDYTYNHKADCASFGESELNDLCPMRVANIKSCSNMANSPSLAGEIYSLNSRCFVTDIPHSVCLESYCNSIDSKIDIVVNEKVYQCDYEGQELDLGSYRIRCPRLAVICPHLVCPANCAGKGVCDYCLETPQCVCDDPFDKTPGCYGDSSSADDEDALSQNQQAYATEIKTAKKLSDLKHTKEENEKELHKDDEVMSNLQNKQMDYRTKVSAQISHLKHVEEKNERELHKDDAVMSHLHNKEIGYRTKVSAQISHLKHMEEANERELHKDDVIMSILHKDEMVYTTKVSAVISHLTERVNGNKRDLEQEDNEISNLREEQLQDKSKISMLEARLEEMKAKALLIHQGNGQANNTAATNL